MSIARSSGLGMCDPQWTTDSIRPWVLHCIDAFGVERCVMGSNWPVDRLFSSYDPVINAYAEIIKGLSTAEQEALFSGTRKRFSAFSRRRLLISGKLVFPGAYRRTRYRSM